jgi:hypothetical protein
MNPYVSLTHFKDLTGAVLPRCRNCEWKLTADAGYGEILGLPYFRGKQIATNGILCAIETDLGKVMIGHADWFVLDEPEDAESAEQRPVRRANIEEFEGLFA